MTDFNRSSSRGRGSARFLPVFLPGHNIKIISRKVTRRRLERQDSGRVPPCRAVPRRPAPAVRPVATTRNNEWAERREVTHAHLPVSSHAVLSAINQVPQFSRFLSMPSSHRNSAILSLFNDAMPEFLTHTHRADADAAVASFL